MAGKLYGVGVGPGDPELLTLKALKVIKACPVILVPGVEPRETVAYQIVKKAYADLDQKELVGVAMPMIKDANLLDQSHDKAAAAVEELLKQGKDVAFLTLGDPTVYSTYLYVHKRILKDGFEAEIISGITSFCAVAARMNMGLVEKAEPLHVIPASYPVEEALHLPGTRVLMKAGRKMGKVKEILMNRQDDVCMIENCGMENEVCYYSAEEIPEEAGYYSLIIVKENV